MPEPDGMRVLPARSRSFADRSWCRAMRRTCRASRARLTLRALEDRTVPATLVWAGDVDANWGTSLLGNTNWNTNTLPMNGDDLVFPMVAANRTNTNNINGLSLSSISFGGSGYVVGGNAISLASLSDSSTVGVSALNLPLTVTSTMTVTVDVAGTTLTAGGAISGVGGLFKVGSGTLRLAGSQANTYSATTTQTAGTLELAKAGVVAIAGNLLVSGGAAREIIGNQIANSSMV